jgi:hypothetical protein
MEKHKKELEHILNSAFAANERELVETSGATKKNHE